jgi:hypothetical protein
MSFTTIACFGNPIDAYLLRIELENQGIEVFLADEHLVSIQPLYSYAIGGVKVRVRSEEMEKTISILNKQRKELATKSVCPAFASSNIQQNFNTLRNGKSFLSYLIALITLTYPLFTKRIKRCLDCNHEFSDKKV